MSCKFSIIIVSLNAGEELKKTVESVRRQTFKNYEIIVKDGCSKDGSTDFLKDAEDVCFVQEPDDSIYDGMNAALKFIHGEYVIFLNCGDRLYAKDVLEKSVRFMQKKAADIYYGNLYRRELGSTDVYPDHISDFTAFRNVPCHQACIYRSALLKGKAYDLRFKVRADYEHFLRCIYRYDARPAHMPFVLSDYEGGGFSETALNKKISAKEHRVITDKYLGKKASFYRFVMIITLQPLREKLAGSRRFSEAYHKIKARIYSIGGKRD